MDLRELVIHRAASVRIRTILTDSYEHTITNRIYVDWGCCPHFSVGGLLVLDGNTDKVVQNITLGTSRPSLAINPTTYEVYVSNYGSNTTSFVDGTTNIVVVHVCIHM
jgi:DNA-binding beta-propeller fold protein YncE